LTNNNTVANENKKHVPADEPRCVDTLRSEFKEPRLATGRRYDSVGIISWHKSRSKFYGYTPRGFPRKILPSKNVYHIGLREVSIIDRCGISAYQGDRFFVTLHVLMKKALCKEYYKSKYQIIAIHIFKKSEIKLVRKN